MSNLLSNYINTIQCKKCILKKIDVVYIYVNNKDKIWLKKILKYLDKDHENDKKYLIYQEIYFSLKTLELFAKKICNKIYIVSDEQKLDERKISKWIKNNIIYIDYKQIVPEKYLPTFNLSTVESFLHNIPNISKYFLYIYNNLFFGNDITLNFFVNNKCLNIFLEEINDKSHNSTNKLLLYNYKNVYKTFYKKYKLIPNFIPIHSYYLINVNLSKDVWDRFYNDIDSKITMFKSNKNINFLFLCYIYGLYKGYYKFTKPSLKQYINIIVKPDINEIRKIIMKKPIFLYCNHINDSFEEYNFFKDEYITYYHEKRSFNLIKDNIIKIDNIFKKLNESNFIYPKFRVYKNKFIKSNYAYATLLIVDESYISGILALGYSIRKNKCKYNLICLVQDKPVYKIIKGEKKLLPGVSLESIKNILKIYDIVYGVNLVQVEEEIKYNERGNDYNNNIIHFTDKEHYKNISVYPTKIQVLGLLNYKKILYLDASNIVDNNIDFLFKKYNNFYYPYDFQVKMTNVGIRGQAFLFEPSLLLYTKALYLSNYYKNIFKNTQFNRGFDEIILYFAIYPRWTEESKYQLLFIVCNERVLKRNITCPIYNHTGIKPFKKKNNNVNSKTNIYNYNYNNSNTEFIIWDKYAKKLLKSNPEFNKYFEHIKSFRNFDF